jgi:hypothetical protein
MYKKIPNIKFQIPKIVFGICFFFFGICASAQCAMCRASLESTGDNSKAEALNDGIVYLMAIPYVLVAVVGFIVYRIYRSRAKV